MSITTNKLTNLMKNILNMRSFVKELNDKDGVNCGPEGSNRGRKRTWLDRS